MATGATSVRRRLDEPSQPPFPAGTRGAKVDVPMWLAPSLALAIVGGEPAPGIARQLDVDSGAQIEAPADPEAVQPVPVEPVTEPPAPATTPTSSA
ncbi:MAG: hypothetical protein IAG13_31105, partial [Deltaproteobacteria bacterium]|nr:hypothetical protein [Nannocystaceae bacterium]